MRFYKLILPVALLLAGCETIYNAHQAQKSIIDRANGSKPLDTQARLVDYSLKELFDFALTNRPSVVASILAVEDARLALKEIYADAPLLSDSPWTSPHLSMSGGYNESSVASHKLKSKTSGNASAGLSLQLLVYDFGRNDAQAKAQVERVIAAELEMSREGYNVFEEVSTAYFNLLESDALLEVAQTNEVESTLYLKQAQERLNNGEAYLLDVSRAKLNLAEAKERTIAASNKVALAGVSLMKALGIDASQGSCEQVYPRNERGLNTATRVFADTKSTASELYESARTNTPTLAISRAKLRAASKHVDYAIADLMPSVSVEVGVNWADPLWAWHWGVSAVQSLFTGYRKVTAVDRAVVAMYRASADLDAEEHRLSTDLESAVIGRDNSVKARESARASVAAALENLKTAKARYAEGEVSSVEYTEAVSSYTTALGNRVSAFYQGQIAEAKLFALQGIMPEFHEEEVKEVEK